MPQAPAVRSPDAAADGRAVDVRRTGGPRADAGQGAGDGAERNRTWSVEKARLAGRRRTSEAAWAALFPTITAQGKYTHNYKNATLNFGALFPSRPPERMTHRQPADDPQADQLDANISATMPLIAPAAYPALEAVKKSVRAAEANYEASRDERAVRRRPGVLLAAAADEVLVAGSPTSRSARATLENAKTRFAAGTVTKVDVDRAELALVRAEQMERDARTRASSRIGRWRR